MSITPSPVQGFSGQSGRFYLLKLVFSNGPVVVGGIQNISYSLQTGVQGWVPEAGSDFKEPQFQMKQVSGSFDRLVLNLRKVRDIFAGGDSSKAVIDFRQYMFQVELDYQEQFANLQGTETSTPNGLFIETIQGVMFTNLSFNLNDPTALSHEGVQFIGKDVSFSLQGSETMVQANPSTQGNS